MRGMLYEADEACACSSCLGSGAAVDWLLIERNRAAAGMCPE